VQTVNVEVVEGDLVNPLQLIRDKEEPVEDVQLHLLQTGHRHWPLYIKVHKEDKTLVLESLVDYPDPETVQVKLLIDLNVELKHLARSRVIVEVEGRTQVKVLVTLRKTGLHDFLVGDDELPTNELAVSHRKDFPGVPVFLGDFEVNDLVVAQCVPSQSYL
jgi:Tfp pilus assembly ATPase PilU